MSGAGGVAKRYRYPIDGRPRTGGRPTSDDERLYVRAVATEVERRLRDRADAPGQHHSSDLEGWVDPGTWAEAQRLLREASRLLHAANRAPGTEGTVHVSATSWSFRMDP